MNTENLRDFVETLARSAGDLTLRYFRKPLQTSEKSEHMGIVSNADIETEKFIISQIRSAAPHHLILAEESAQTQTNYRDGDHIWIIDPIDGTTNFVQGNVYYCISIAVYKMSGGKCEPVIGCVYQPYSKDLYISERGRGAFLNGRKIHVSQIENPKKGSYGTGFAYNSEENLSRILKSIQAVRTLDPCATVRVNGAAALDICRTAEGIMDGFWEFNLSPWDMAAGNLIMKEAGGLVTNFQGQEFDPLRDKNILCGSVKTHPLLLNLIRPIFT